MIPFLFFCPFPLSVLVVSLSCVFFCLLSGLLLPFLVYSVLVCLFSIVLLPPSPYPFFLMLPRLFIRQLNSFSFFSSPSFYRTFSSFSSSHFSSPLLSSSSSLSSPSSPSSPASDTSTGLRELEGLLVVSIEQAVAAPLCSSRLCDDGARVLKIERPPKGDFARYYDRFIDNRDCSYFVWLNRGKESVAIDLKNNKQKDELIKIIEKADIFIQNLAPGQTEKMGLGSQMLRVRKKRLI